VETAWLARRPREELVAAAVAALSRPSDADRRQQLRAALEDPAAREAIRRVTREAIERRGADLDVIERAPDRRLEGLTLAAAAKVLGVDVVDAAIAIDLMDAQVTNFHMSEQDVEEILRWPFTAISTDGTVPYFGEGLPHPRSYGTYPRLIRHYVMEQGVITLAEAIRRATGLVADIVGLEDRGYLKPGHAADLVVFDPLTIDSCSTYRDPHCYSRGIEYLVVNGVVTLDRGRHTGALAGRILTPKRSKGSG
ncbi:MAG TPA: amidohydrolase family protein, partial [Vicinamibacterales bacterium]|nr:amidohydrolase family protein [Vicinamibacterales bacterium]